MQAFWDRLLHTCAGIPKRETSANHHTPGHHAEATSAPGRGLAVEQVCHGTIRVKAGSGPTMLGASFTEIRMRNR